MQRILWVAKGWRSAVRRLRTTGFRATFVWGIGRVVPVLTGIPTLRRFSEVVPGLYIGSQHGRAGLRRLVRQGFRHGVNLRAEFDDHAHGLALESYCYLPTIDGTPPTLEQLAEGVAFIADALGKSGKVYIHCLSGIGRAPTLAAAYLIAQGHPPDQAIERIRRVRPFVDLEPTQVARLREFARRFTTA
jgi:hypothetical protein